MDTVLLLHAHFRVCRPHKQVVYSTGNSRERGVGGTGGGSGGKGGRGERGEKRERREDGGGGG